MPETGLQVKELGPATWPDFVRIMEKHDGVWGGCWCVAFHLTRDEEKRMSGQHRALKERLVREDQSHAALVYDGPDVVGWCQFGSPAELPARLGGFGGRCPTGESSSFLWGGTESMFREAGFEPLGALGSSKLVTRKLVHPIGPQPAFRRAGGDLMPEGQQLEIACGLRMSMEEEDGHKQPHQSIDGCEEHEPAR